MDYKPTMQCVWFRTDLRLADNPALSAALANQAPTVAIFVASESQWQQHNKASIQIDLIKRRLLELEKELHALNIPLLVLSCPWFKDVPLQLHTLCNDLGILHLFANKEYEADELRRDADAVTQLSDVQCAFYDAKCAVEVGKVLNKTHQPYKVFTPFKKAWREYFYQHFPTIEKVTASVQLSTPQLNSLQRYSEKNFTNSISNESKAWSVSNKTILNTMRQFCREKSQQYDDQRDYPAIEGTSQLSPYLAIGAISAKQCILRLHLEANNQLTQGQEIWLDELIWREFYTHLLHFYPLLSKNHAFLSFDKYIQWNNDNNKFEQWCNGETGFPIVDAAMKQLNNTGWMHNRLRMITASFLVKDLHIDWRWGEQYFMSKLIDGDFASNNGGWQWCASVGCDSTPYFRIFNPTTQSERFDNNGVFIKHWLPELTELRGKLLHQPNSKPLLKPDSYLVPIIEHSVQRLKTLDIYKQAKAQDVAS